MRRAGIFFKFKQRRSVTILRRILVIGAFAIVALWSHGLFASPKADGSKITARTVKIYTEDFAPFNYATEDGLTGAGADMVREMAKRLGHDGNFEILPWKRALQIVKAKPGTAVFSMVRTSERENEYKWVGPILVTRGWLYKMTSSSLEIRELDDARKVAAIGVQAGGAAERMLHEQGFNNLAALYTPGNALQLLASDRIDLWEASDLVMEHQRRKFELAASEIEPVIGLGTYRLYLAFSPQTPDFVVRPWQMALEELCRDGTFAAIGRKYGVTMPDDDTAMAPTDEFDLMTR
ncbi:substrate-binding periplasmic protein [Thalassospira australica]|uniref:substrate-binding periplasmic protein n=1 Tax=Thalassospira australica TaxID=1528106 RepID=UPI00384A63AA